MVQCEPEVAMAGEQDKKRDTGANITISEKSTEKVVDALLDAFSPITQGLGALGDRIHVYRAVTLIGILRRAKKIANEEGHRLDLPPPKFLIPYLEAASLEDETDAGLQEKWARLLAGAGQTPDSLSYFARAVLAELSPEEARLLDNLVRTCRVLEHETFGAYLTDGRTKLAGAAKLIDDSVELLDAGKLEGEQAHQQMLLAFKDLQGVEVVGFAINTKSKAFQSRNGYVSFSSPAFSEQYHHFLILEGRRIIDIADFAPENFLASSVVAIQHVSFTKLGFELVRKIYKRAASGG